MNEQEHRLLAALKAIAEMLSHVEGDCPNVIGAIRQAAENAIREFEQDLANGFPP